MPDREPGEVPPRRLLARAPSERYAAARQAPALARGGGRLVRALLLGSVAAIAGIGVHVAFAVLLLATGGLLVVAATLGFVVGAFVRHGAGPNLNAGLRRSVGVVLALVAIFISLAVNWALSGRYLGPLDFLDQVYGLLVPLQLAAAVVGALAGTR